MKLTNEDVFNARKIVEEVNVKLGKNKKPERLNELLHFIDKVERCVEITNGLEYVDLDGFIGKTPLKIINKNDEVVFIFSDCTIARMYHQQNCCETVTLDDVLGDLQSLVGEPITYAKTAYSGDNFDDETYYLFKNDKDACGVTLLWRGFSNGYYSSDVEIEWVEGEQNRLDFLIARA